ncbi:MAG: 3-oxoacyl-ACP reductase FabG [Filifactor alocis]|nr:3-oxoacyl-ACP reductase FabG [Filifactor alocis]
MRTVLVTGSSRGIGREIARRFAMQGDRVVINYYQSKDRALSLQRELLDAGKSAMVVRADVSCEEEVKAMVEEAEKTFGKIDVLVNNAGIASMTMFNDIDTKMWNRIFAVNVNGVYHCCKYVLPSMISRKKGKIINVASIWGLVGASCETHYSATKGAIIAFTKALAKEEGPSNIQVNAVAPGAIMTDMIAGLDKAILDMVVDETPLGVLGKPEDVASAVLYLASEEANFITGQVLSMNGGLVI